MFKNAIFTPSVIVLVSALSLVSPARAESNNCGGSCGASTVSALSAVSTASVVIGSVEAVVASGKVVVESVEAVGSGFVIVLKGVSDGAKVSVKVSGEAMKGISAATGASVELVASATGHMLIWAGKAIAFIPNEVGTALIHQTKVQ